MKYRKLAPFLFMFLLPSCGWMKFSFSRCDTNNISDAALIHEEKLRRHFTYGNTGVDLSTLIAETRRISARLKAAGMMSDANRFDSYTDVLMFGNRTVDESLNDVMILVHASQKKAKNIKSENFKAKNLKAENLKAEKGWCDSLSATLDNIFGW